MDLCAHPSPVLISWAHRGYTCLVLPLNPDSPPTLCSWNHGIPCPKSFKPATRDCTILFPRAAFLRVDCTTVYATPGPGDGQGWLLVGVRTQLKCVPFMVQNWAQNMRRRKDRPALPTLSYCRDAEKSQEFQIQNWFSRSDEINLSREGQHIFLQLVCQLNL